MSHSTDVITSYEHRLDRDSRWAMDEGGLYFEAKSEVFKTLRKITGRLDALGIPYAVVGGMALFHHGFRRFTDDVDLLVTKSDLQTIHERLDGLGFLPPFAKSKQLRDTDNGVRIEFLTTGDYPGDGKPKPVAFPDPSAVTVTIDGIRYLKLSTLVELKLASGMTTIHRYKDITDVIELIKTIPLPREFADELDPYVRPTFVKLWDELHQTPDPYA
jgi:hypothetical protein